VLHNNYITELRRPQQRSAKCLKIFCQILTEFGFSRQISTIVSNVKSEANPSSGSRADIGGEMGGREDMTKLIGASRDYADAPKNIAALST
jgi:hypothetical protein